MSLMVGFVRINGDRINGLFHLRINGICWGYNPLNFYSLPGTSKKVGDMEPPKKYREPKWLKKHLANSCFLEKPIMFGANELLKKKSWVQSFGRH